MVNKGQLKVGIISPIGEVPPELTELYGDKLCFLPANAKVTALNNEGYVNAIDHIPKVVEDLLSEGAQGLSIMGTSLTFFKGRKFNEEFEANLREHSGLPTITMTTAVVQALKAVKAQSIAVLTPYSDEVTQELVKTLSEYKMNVTSSSNIPGLPMSEIIKVPPSQIVSWGLDAIKDKKPDCLLISCGGLRTIEATEELERKLEIPVISSSIAGAWATARLMGLSGKATKGGMLLK